MQIDRIILLSLPRASQGGTSFAGLSLQVTWTPDFQVPHESGFPGSQLLALVPKALWSYTHTQRLESSLNKLTGTKTLFHSAKVCRAWSQMKNTNSGSTAGRLKRLN